MENEEEQQVMSSRRMIRCHYEVLGVERNADDATIKKAHRKLALRLHPDKNVDDKNNTHHEFLAVQQAYECLSDAVERKWYDEHREAILKGWTAYSDDAATTVDMLFDVMPYMYAGCYSGYNDDDPNSFYSVYRTVFQQIFKGELAGEGSSDYLSQEFGDSQSPWETVAAFYQAWESFSSTLNYAWVDLYDYVTQADNRRVRRAMEDENKKARRHAKRARNEDVAALVRFVKRRDPRVQARQTVLQQQKAAQKIQLEQQAIAKKKEKKQALEEWRQQACEEMAATEEEDRLAGRIRLADLEDDYDYGIKKGKKGKKKKKNKQPESESDDDDKAETNTAAEDTAAEGKDGSEEANNEASGANDGVAAAAKVEEQTEEEEEVSSYESSSSEEDEPDDAWRCECCKKDFKSQGQMDNHLKSKKHKVAWKKYEAKLAKLEAELMEDVLDELETIEDDA